MAAEQKFAATKSPNKKVKTLTLLNVVAAIFTSVFLVDAIVPGAATGTATIAWYAIFAVVFYIPYGLITAEFSSKIPEEGGVYAWVKRTLGLSGAKRIAWYYWVNVGIWAPSISIYIAHTMQEMWFPKYTNIWVLAAISIVFMWASLAFSYFPLSENTKIYSAATIGKIVIVLCLFAGMIIWLAGGNKVATDYSSMGKDMAGGSALVFMPALIYNILGLETISGEAKRINKPKKTMPRAIIIVVITLVIFYIATTFAVQAIKDTAGSGGQLDISAIIEVLGTAFGKTVAAKVIVQILGVIFIFTMFVETMGWVSGANASILEASVDKQVPNILTKLNKKQMPFLSSIVLGSIGTVTVILFTGIQAATGIDTVFWSLFGASSNVLFVSYILMFVAYFKGKFGKNAVLDKLDGFSVNKYLALGMTVVATIVISITWFLLLWSPGYQPLYQTLPIGLTVLAAIGSGEIAFWYQKRKNEGKGLFTKKAKAKQTNVKKTRFNTVKR